MKKVFALLLALAMMLSVAAIAEEAVPSPTADSAIASFTPEGITPSISTTGTVQQLLKAIEETDDNDKVFGSSGLSDLSSYELVELVGLEIADYDESMGEVTLNVKFSASLEQSAQYIALLGLINGGEVTWQSIGLSVEADGSATLTFTAEQAKAVAEGEAVIAILQKI